MTQLGAFESLKRTVYRITSNGKYFRVERAKRKWFKSFFWGKVYFKWVVCRQDLNDGIGGTTIPAVFTSKEAAWAFIDELKTEEKPWVEVSGPI